MIQTPMDAEYLIWILFTGCLILSFLLSGMEAGVFALSRLRIRQQMRAGRYSARVLHDLLENPENFLWTILVGNTIANFLILGWMFAILDRSLSGRPAWFLAAYALLVFLFYVLFDLLPKILFRTYPNRLCISLAQPFRLIHFLLRPLVGLVEHASDRLLRWRGGHTFTGRLFGNREELRFVMQESAQALTSEERAMINRVLDLQSLTIRSAMKPLAQVVTVNTQAPASEALRLCREHGFTRLPAVDDRDESRRVTGLISCNSLLYQEALEASRPVRDFLRPALFLDEDLRLEMALRRLQRSGQRLAIVLGRDRRESGIVTLQDILRIIFGEVSL
jgi:putative hemolysin